MARPPLRRRGHERFARPVAAQRTGPGGAAELAEQRPRQGVLLRLPLRVPLHSHREGGVVAKADPLDEPVGRAGFDLQALCQAIDALSVQRVHHYFGTSYQTFEGSATREANRMARLEYLFRTQVVAPGHSMVVHARHLVHSIVQSAAEGDIQLLDAAAYPEHRNLGPHAGADEREHRVVSAGVDELVLGEGIPSVVIGFDVGAPAGQQQPVDAGGKALQVDPVGKGGQDDRHALREAFDRFHAVRAGGVDSVALGPDLDVARRDANERFAGTQGFTLPGSHGQLTLAPVCAGKRSGNHPCPPMSKKKWLQGVRAIFSARRRAQGEFMQCPRDLLPVALHPQRRGPGPSWRPDRRR